MLLRNGSSIGDSAELTRQTGGPEDVVATSDKSTEGTGGGTSDDAGRASESGTGLANDHVDDIASSANMADAETSILDSVDSGNADVELVTDNLPAPSPQPSLQFFASGSDADAQAGGDGKKVEFFGIAAEGRRFVYVVDKSSSMSGEPFEKARDELLRSIKQLNANQSFFIIFYDTDPYPQPTKTLQRARRPSIVRINKWIAEITPNGGTDPMPAIQIALSLKPDAVYVLSDGEFDTSAVTATVLLNAQERIVIHTVAIQNDAVTLRQIAKQNGGVYRLVP
ncbi:MAG: VWA domain-containing protein [Pirellulales bacterium]